MSDNKNCLDCMLKTDGAGKDDGLPTINNSIKYKNTKRQMRGLCNALSKDSSEYKPDVTVKNIVTYLNKTDKLDRILYSEISNYIFGLNSIKRPTFYSNIERLLLYVLNDNNKVDDDTKKIVIKIYDHVQLNINQIENASNIFKNSIMDAKSKLHDEIKGIEREYITILGIFASIVLAFVGGITFTTSVLQNIDKVSVFRLILTVDVIGAVLVNVIYLLISFILMINDKEKEGKEKEGKEKEGNRRFIKTANWILFGIAVLVLVGWFLDILELQKYISKFFIWTSK